MEDKIIKFALETVLIFSIFLGPIYYMIAFFENLIPEYSGLWQLNSINISTMTTFGFLTFALCLVLGGRYIDKLSDKWIVIGLLVFAGFDLAMLAISIDFWFYYIFVLINGAVIGLSIPAVLGFLYRDLPNFLRKYYIPLTLVIVFIAFLILGNYLLNIIPWRTIFIFTGFANFVIADVFVIFFFKDNR